MNLERVIKAQYLSLIHISLLSERNAAIQSDIDRLSTDEGIEDVAREQLGWVSKGETAGVVVGLSEDETSPTPDTVHSQIDVYKRQGLHAHPAQRLPPLQASPLLIKRGSNHYGNQQNSGS